MATYNIYKDGDISLSNFFKIISSQMPLIIISSAIFGFLFFGYSFLQQDKFTSKIVITYSQQNTNISGMGSGLGGLGQLAGIDLGSNTSPAEEESYARLLSRVNIQSFLANSEELRDYFTKNSQGGNIENFEPIFNLVNRSVSMSRSKLSGITNIYFSAFDRDISANFLNQLILHTNEFLRGEAKKLSTKKVEFLTIESSTNSYRNIQAIFGRMIEAEIKNKMVANTSEEYAFRVIDPAPIPLSKSSPRTLFNTMLGLLLGLIAGVVLALLRNSKAD
jgi:uncharacterized protein involved in exopolysaccharide biosynthesis